MRTVFRIKHLFALGVFALACNGIAFAQQSPMIVLSAPSDQALAERGIVTFSISNPTDERIAIVSFETPFAVADDRLANVEFQVLDPKGTELAYRGRNVYFGPPDSSSFLILGPHETLKKNIDVAKEYGITNGGAYKVTYVKNIRVLRSSAVERINSIRPGEDVPIESGRSNTLTVWINDTLLKAKGLADVTHDAVEGAAETSCTDSQRQHEVATYR